MAVPVVLLIAMTGTWALLIALMRAPMGAPSPIAPLQVFMLTGAVMLAWREAADRVLRERWSSYALVLVITLAVLFSPALVWVLGGATAFVLPPLLIAVWIVGLRGLARECARFGPWHLVAAVLLGAALGFTYFLYVNTKGYGTVFAPEQTLLGTQHRDTLFHASIAAMLGQFGVPATGLDGLVRVRYYFLSHALIGVTGRWIGVPPIHAYYLVNQLLILPLLLFSLTAATFWLWRPAASVRAGLTTLLVPLLLLMTFEYWEWGSYLVSESFALSLALLMLTLPLVMELQERLRDSTTGLTIMRYSALALAALAIVLTKSSVAALFACGVVFVALRARFNLLHLLVVAAMMAATLRIGAAVTSTPAYAGQPLIGPLHFFRSYPTVAYPNLWAIVLMLVPGMWAWRSASSHLRVNIEMLIVMALAALTCGVIFQLGSGAAYYFMNVGVWVSMVLAAGTFILPRLEKVQRQGALVAGLALAVAAAIFAQPDKRHAGTNLVALAESIESQTAAQTGGGATDGRPVPSLMNFLSSDDPVRRHIAETVGNTPGGRMRMRIVSSAAEAVYIPPANSAFWRMSKIVCTAQPFFVPALSARPLIDGLPPSRDECPLPPDTGYGYGDYSTRSRSTVMSDAQLCTDVRARGFKTALILDSPDASRVLDCR